jgi:hypothetical protein
MFAQPARWEPQTHATNGRHTLEVLALGTGVGIVGLIVIVLIVVLVLRLL